MEERRPDHQTQPDSVATNDAPGFLRERPRPGQRQDRVRVAAFALAAALFAGCQSYEPRPLDPAAHREAWHGRTLDAGSLREFLDRLDLDVEAQAAEFDPSNGLNQSEGQLVALVFHPGLRLARLRVERTIAGSQNAGRWADPELSLSVLRITESVPDRWVIAPGLAFSIPLSGRLAVERELAGAERQVAEGVALEAEWSVWHEVEAAWIDWSAACLRVQETERLVEAVEGLVGVASQLVESGELPRTEAALFRVEEAQRKNQLQRLRGEVEVGEQRLRALMGLAPEAPIDLLPTQAIGSNPLLLGGVAGPALIEARNPSLARLRREYAVSEERLRLEIKKQLPDLSLGPQFESDEGQSRIGFFGAIPLPFLNANRRGIAEARVEREIARASFETEYELFVGRWAMATARAEALREQRRDMEQVLVPLVDRQLEDSLELLRLGEGTGLVLLESLTRAHQAKLELIETRSAEGHAQAELTYLIGPAASEESSAGKEENP